ncbi:MAG: hypothetical protein J6A37_05980 [Oscillospiraceae bacterium]|nr:hypothetical protein [Oscillospiraceae bacterium]
MGYLSEKECCPVCGENADREEIARFDMCLDCFADSLVCGISESILYDFLKEYGRELKDYIDSNYDY